MRSTLDNLLLGTVVLTLPVIAIFLISILIWFVTDLSLLVSVLLSLGIEVFFGVCFYFYIRNEVKQFKIDIEVNDDDGIL